MQVRAWAANNLAAKLLAGPWTPEAIGRGLDEVIGPVHHSTRKALTARLVLLAHAHYPPSHHALCHYLLRSRLFRPPADHAVDVVLDPPRFQPAPPFADLELPAIATLGELGAWLGLSPEQLDWLSDFRQSHGRAIDARLQHYRYAFLAKPGGGFRLIEAPKARLKAIQRKISKEILSRAPVHESAHGFVPCRSCLTGAQIHAGEAVVVRFDLAQFFPTVGLGRIHGVFRSLGYPWAVARRLAGLCATATPANIFMARPKPERPDRGRLEIYLRHHLPQGAPTSPALANFLTWTLDRRLHGLARAAGANYTRYADDLSFSGDAAFQSGLWRFERALTTIVNEEGFALNPQKTRIMPRSAAQRVTGVVVNEHCNVPRAEFDRLRAIIFNCVRHGPQSQNRLTAGDFRRHLEGRIGWIEQVNPARGAKLRCLFEGIEWAA